MIPSYQYRNLQSCAQPMRHVVTKQCHLSLAGRKLSISPGLAVIEITSIKIRRSHDCLIFKMGTLYRGVCAPHCVIAGDNCQFFSPSTYRWVNSLWPSDAIWRHRSGSTLALVMACCLKAPSHYLNQCWLIVSKVQWHSSEGNFTKDTSATNHWINLKN